MESLLLLARAAAAEAKRLARNRKDRLRWQAAQNAKRVVPKIYAPHVVRVPLSGAEVQQRKAQRKRKYNTDMKRRRMASDPKALGHFADETKRRRLRRAEHKLDTYTAVCSIVRTQDSFRVADIAKLSKSHGGSGNYADMWCGSEAENWTEINIQGSR